MPQGTQHFDAGLVMAIGSGICASMMNVDFACGAPLAAAAAALFMLLIVIVASLLGVWTGEWTSQGSGRSESGASPYSSS